MSIHITDCPQCGGEIKEQHLANQADGMDLYHCPLCGQDVGLTVSHGNDVPRLNETWELLFEWSNGKPTLDQIQTARQLLPNLAKEPMGNLKKRMEASRTFELGQFIGGEAQDLMHRAKELGLPIRSRRVLNQ